MQSLRRAIWQLRDRINRIGGIIVLEKLSRTEFEDKLIEKHGKIYSKRWWNYPGSIFYYDIENFDGTTDNIGIYTSSSIYSLESA